MADYYRQYRRRVLHRRWRRRFMAAGLLLLLIMLGAIGLPAWKAAAPGAEALGCGAERHPAAGDAG